MRTAPNMRGRQRPFAESVNLPITTAANFRCIAIHYRIPSVTTKHGRRYASGNNCGNMRRRGVNDRRCLLINARQLRRRALALANERLGVRLQEEEWVAFALHFINHRWAGGDLSNTMAMTDTIGRSFKLLEQEWGTPIDQNSMSSARFVTHIRYLFVRAMEDRQLANSEIDVMNAVRDRYPEATQAALKLARQIEESVKHELTHEEVAYLALHTARLYTEVHFDN